MVKAALIRALSKFDGRVIDRRYRYGLWRILALRTQRPPRSGLRLARPELGEKLAFGFEPIAARVAGEAEAMAALGDEVGARPDHVVRRFSGGRERN